MVEKYQIYSNPIPPNLFFSDFDPSSKDKPILAKWCNYYLDLTEQLQMEVLKLFPESYHDKMSLTPPTKEAAEKLIHIFHLNCEPKEIMNATKSNYKAES